MRLEFEDGKDGSCSAELQAKAGEDPVVSAITQGAGLCGDGPADAVEPNTLHPGIQRAHRLLGQDVVLVRITPETKKPVTAGWPALSAADMTPAYLQSFRPEENVGVVLGQVIWSLDVDSDGAAEVMRELNPCLRGTLFTHRENGRGGNFWFRIPAGEEIALQPLSSAGGTAWGEIRGTGAQTMIYGRAVGTDGRAGEYQVIQDVVPITMAPGGVVFPDGVGPTRRNPVRPAGAAPRQRPEVCLPGPTQDVSQCAKEIFEALAASGEYYRYAGEVQALEINSENGKWELIPIDCQSFISAVEKHVRLVRPAKKGETINAVMSDKQARAILMSQEARTILPRVTRVSRRPCLHLDEGGDVRILGFGFHPRNAGGLLVLSEAEVEEMTVCEACEVIMSFLAGFSFPTEADRGRAVALLLTIALVDMGLMGSMHPMFMIVADASQAGKSLLATVLSLMNEIEPYLVSNKTKGLGSLEQSIGGAFVAGKKVIILDNLRKDLDSEFFEGWLTARSGVGARIPYRAEIEIRPGDMVAIGTSNGVRITQDLKNRLFFIKLTKNTDRRVDAESEEQLVCRVSGNANRIRSAIYTLIGEWLGQGRPRLPIDGFHRVEWAAAMNYIVHRVMGLPPLLDGHALVADELASGYYVFLREVCAAAMQKGYGGRWLRAYEIADLCNDRGIQLPNSKPEVQADAMKVGKIMGSVMPETGPLVLTDWTIARRSTTSAQSDPSHEYRIEQVRPLAETSPTNA